MKLGGFVEKYKDIIKSNTHTSPYIFDNTEIKFKIDWKDCDTQYLYCLGSVFKKDQQPSSVRYCSDPLPKDWFIDPINKTVINKHIYKTQKDLIKSWIKHCSSFDYVNIKSDAESFEDEDSKIHFYIYYGKNGKDYVLDLRKIK